MMVKNYYPKIYLLLFIVLASARLQPANATNPVITIYSSPNPKTDPSKTAADLLQLRVADVFHFNATSDSSGIIAKIDSGGHVAISVWAFDPQSSDGKGELDLDSAV